MEPFNDGRNVATLQSMYHGIIGDPGRFLEPPQARFVVTVNKTHVQKCFTVRCLIRITTLLKNTQLARLAVRTLVRPGL